MNNYNNDTYLMQNTSTNDDDTEITNNNDWGEIVDHNIFCDNNILDPHAQNHISQSELKPTNSNGSLINEYDHDHFNKENTIKIFDHIDIEDVKSLDVKSLSDLILLEKSSLIVKNIKFQFNKRCNEDKDTFIKWLGTSLLWLNMATRNKQEITSYSDIPINKEFTSQINKESTISRASYKFCEFGHNCRFNYSIKEKCYAQHFVFSHISQDISSVIDFIIEDYETVKLRQITNNNDLNEIKTSINTITYVINHMYDELLQLKNINHQYYENYEKRVYNFCTIDGKKRIKKTGLVHSTRRS